MQRLEKRYWSRDGHVVDFHRGRKSVRVSTVDKLTLKEFVVVGDLDASQDELVNSLFKKMDSILGNLG
jgi:hypothetical protein